MFSIKELQKIFIPPLCDLLSIRIRTDKNQSFYPVFQPLYIEIYKLKQGFKEIGRDSFF